MKKPDAIVQTLLFCFSLIVLTLVLSVNSRNIFLLLLLQITLGFWQLGSASLILNNKEKYSLEIYRKALMYLKWMRINVVVAILMIFWSPYILAIWLLLCWWLSIYYYVHTIKSAFAKAPKRKTFMDILN